MWLLAARLTGIGTGVGSVATLVADGVSSGSPDHSVEIALIGTGGLVLSALIGIVGRRSRQASPDALASTMFAELTAKDRQVVLLTERVDLLEHIMAAHDVPVPDDPTRP